MSNKILNIRVVVGEFNGSAIFSPFPYWDDHRGESYWLAGNELKVLEDNSIHIPAKLMREFGVKKGYLRKDGKFAIAVKSKRFADTNHKRQFGGDVIYSKDAELYLEKGKNNSFIPESMFDGERTRLKMVDHTEGYELKVDMDDEI